jgi:hypothetical protein
MYQFKKTRNNKHATNLLDTINKIARTPTHQNLKEKKETHVRKVCHLI